jgi:hypothetical protein
MFNVRFHLGAGQHYKHWQFKDTITKRVWYIHPEEQIIELHNCVLYNNRNVANKIYMGANKDVCAWIKFKDGFKYDDSYIPSYSTHLKYDPRKLPYWHTWSGRNIDGLAFDILHLTSKGVFYNECRQDILNPLKIAP